MYLYTTVMGIRETFKQNLKFYRKRMGLTQERLSELCELNINYIAEIERASSKFPKPETVDKLAAVLNIRPSMLFDERGSPENIKESFARVYASSLEKKLKERIDREIENVCRMM